MSKALPPRPHDRFGRAFVPDDYDEPGFLPRQAVVSGLHVIDRGPDVLLEIFVRGLRVGDLTVPAADEAELRRRLFADPPKGDAEYAGRLVQELEDLAAVQDIEGVRMKRRELMTYIGALRLAALRPPVVTTSFVTSGTEPVAQGDGDGR